MHRDWVFIVGLLVFSVATEAVVFWDAIFPPAYAKGNQESGGFNVGGGDCRGCTVDHNVQKVPGFNNISPRDDKGGGDSGGNPDTNHGLNGPGDSNPW